MVSRPSAESSSPKPPSIWYMGAKGRVLDGFLDDVIAREVPEDGVVLDLFTGTGIVAAHCARAFRTIANDVQEYARVIASSFIEHDSRDRDDFLASLDFDADLLDAYLENRGALERLYAAALRREQSLLGALADAAGKRARGDKAKAERTARVAAYREFLELPGAVFGDTRAPDALYERARELLSASSLERYHADPTRRPACLVTAYYAHIYFSLRQAIEIDSLRAAIDAIPSQAPFATAKRTHWLSALIHAASVCTSGTSHFAQPRHLTKDSEIVAMARRRRQDVLETALRFSDEIKALVGSIDYREGNRAVCGDYREIFGRSNGNGVSLEALRPDLVYVDPPYTADNYSRFYHVLEMIARYDYAPLETRGGEVVRGRYPAIERRFQSDFCKKRAVEDEFERVLSGVATSGAKLVLSYAWPGGLLLKRWAEEDPAGDPIERLRALCGRHYGEVEVRTKRLMHSGQGDSNIDTEELLVICRKPQRRR